MVVSAVEWDIPGFTVVEICLPESKVCFFNCEISELWPVFRRIPFES